MNSIFQSLTPNLTTKIEFIDSSSNTPELSYSLTNRNDRILLLTSVERPAKLRVNLNLNTIYLDEQFVKQVTIDYNIKRLPYDIRSVVEFTVTNTTLEQVLSAEVEVLKYFRTYLWRVSALFGSVENRNLDIIFIRPEATSGTFRFAIGSDVGLWEKLLEFISMKDMQSDACRTVSWSELDNFKQATRLNFDLCSIVERPVNHQTSDDGPLIINTNYDVEISDPATIRSRKLIIAILSASTLILSIGIYLFYKIIKSYSRDLAYRKGST